MRDIKAGEELFLSYFPLNWSLQERTERLQQDYGFQCSCERCNLEKIWESEDSEGEEISEDELKEEHSFFFSIFLCPKENCGGTIVKFPNENGEIEGVEEDLEEQKVECNACGNILSLKEVLEFKEEEESESDYEE